MIPSDQRDRDRILKLLKRRPVVFDPLAPPKPTTAQLMEQLANGFRDEYTAGEESRGEQAKGLMGHNPKESK